MGEEAYDFCGWATKANVKCTDGRTIMPNALEWENDTVPMVWNHKHDSPFNVLGHARLENRDDGVFAYCKFNDTEQGQNAKLLVQHGDVNALSIYANGLKQDGSRNVKHGVIRELSLVLAGANPKALIQTVLSHSNDPDFDDDDEIMISLRGPGCDIQMYHSDTKKEESEKKEDNDMDEEKKTSDEDMSGEGKTIKDVYESMTDEQKDCCLYMIGKALESQENDDNEEGGNDMKQNAFDKDQTNDTEVLTHADFDKIFADAKRCGSLREAFQANVGEDAVLAHSIDTTGMTVATGTQTYGFNDASMLFPEYRNLNNPPEWISRDMGWVNKVMGAVHHTPFSRIKSTYANITEDDARARGYIKGKQKVEEVFTTLKRTTDPQTIYKKQKLDRDDIIDITDFDVVAWIRGEMRIMLNEEIARAILIGDGRSPASDDKIQEIHVRPIMNDVPLFNTKVRVAVPNAATDEEVANATIKAAIKARKNYKGSGNPTFFTTEDVLTDMLLIEDGIGHKLYKSEAELATALRVKEIVTVEPMENQEISINSTDYPLIGIIVNLTDYNVGADKGGAISLFDDFDIDVNQYKYLIETRISGALIKPYSALTLYLDRAVSNP